MIAVFFISKDNKACMGRHMHDGVIIISSAFFKSSGAAGFWGGDRQVENHFACDSFYSLSHSIRPFSLLVMKIPSLTSLGLRSLREISDGSVYISNNVNLCYHHTVDWIQIFTGSRRQRRRNNNDIKDNKPQNQCGETSCTH